MSMSDDVIYRVLKLPKTLRVAMKEARDANEQTNAQFLAQVVDEKLPTLVEQLEQLGFGRVPGTLQTARLPFSDSAGTLASLRDASDKLQIPATRLLQICLATAVRETPTIVNHRRRRKSSRATGNSRKDRDGKVTGGNRKRRTAAK